MYSRADFYVYNRYSSREEKEEKNMEYLTGVKPKETKEISELLEQTEAGTKVKVNGAVHTIRDMGTVAFVILKRQKNAAALYSVCMRKACQALNSRM